MNVCWRAIEMRLIYRFYMLRNELNFFIRIHFVFEIIRLYHRRRMNWRAPKRLEDYKKPPPPCKITNIRKYSSHSSLENVFCKRSETKIQFHLVRIDCIFFLIYPQIVFTVYFIRIGRVLCTKSNWIRRKKGKKKLSRELQRLRDIFVIKPWAGRLF